LCPAGAPAAIRLRGTAVWTAGSDSETGTAVLEASNAGASRVALTLAGGSRVEVQSRHGIAPRAAVQASGMPGADGAARTRKLGDAFTPAAWFYTPLLLGDLGSGGVTAVNLGAVTIAGASLDHLRLQRAYPRQTAKIAAELASLSQADLYLDPATLLPRRLRFERHPDGNIRQGVPVEIRYRNYKQIDGVTVPGTIERYYNGTLQLSITITGADASPQLAASDFVLGGAQ